VCYVYVPHTTSGITINENTDPNVGRDILKELNKVIPFDDQYSHAEGNSSAHIKSTLVGVSKAVLVEEGRLALGTWQAIFYCEFDGPRDRRVFVKVMKDWKD
jgi:secondary thiamine-phosphate synthase enzyme